MSKPRTFDMTKKSIKFFGIIGKLEGYGKKVRTFTNSDLLKIKLYHVEMMKVIKIIKHQIKNIDEWRKYVCNVKLSVFL